MPVVVDASTLVAKLTSSDDFAQSINEIAYKETFVAPDLIIIETVSGLKKMKLRNEIDEELFDSAYLKIEQEDIILVPSKLVLPHLKELLGQITAYDASYVALANKLNYKLITADKKLANIAQKYCQVECFN